MRHSRETNGVYREMCSLRFEAQCLIDEHRSCDDAERRRSLLNAYVEVQERWRGLVVTHAAMCRRIQHF